MTQGVGVNQGVQVDFVIEGVLLDTDPRVKLMNEVDTGKECDGNGEWNEVPNLRAHDRRKVV